MSRNPQVLLSDAFFNPDLIDLEAAQTAVALGADVNQPLIRNGEERGWYAIHEVAYLKHEAAAAWLLEKGALLNIPSPTKEMPIHIAVNYGALEVVKLFVEREPQLVNQPNAEGATPLLIAVFNRGLENSRSDEIIDYLLSQNADPDAYSKLYNASPLSRALEQLKHHPAKTAEFRATAKIITSLSAHSQAAAALPSAPDNPEIFFEFVARKGAGLPHVLASITIIIPPEPAAPKNTGPIIILPKAHPRLDKPNR